MIREGTAARNLETLLPLFDPAYSHRCLLVTDDRHPADLLRDGHVDNIVRLAAKKGKNVITAIKMATIQAAQYFSLPFMGAIAPGYKADLLVLDDLDEISIRDVYVDGKRVVEDGKVSEIKEPKVQDALADKVLHSFHLSKMTAEDFYIQPQAEECRVIQVLKGELLTNEKIVRMDWAKGNGIDVAHDILKLAVVERHNGTGHKGLGYVSGLGLKEGAIASSVSHDSHNLIVLGTNDEDMAIAANKIIEMGGGNVVVKKGEVLAEMPLPIAGLMSMESAEEVARQNALIRDAVKKLSVPEGIEPFMNLAFVSLPVIPHLKMTPNGLVDVDTFQRVSLYVEK